MNSFRLPWANATCTYQGTEFKPGESVPSVDGCNSCSCDESGQVMCTLMACKNDSEHIEANNFANWHTYNGQTVIFKYPFTWTVEEKEIEGSNTLIVSKGDGDAVYYTSLFIGSPFIFSTSGAIEANESYSKEVGTTSFNIRNKNYSADIVELLQYKNNRISEDKYFRFQAEMDQGITVTAQMLNLNDKEIIAQILSTFEFLDDPKTGATDAAKEQEIRQAVTAVLAKPYMLNPIANPLPGVELLSVEVRENSVSLDFNNAIASEGMAAFEDVFSQISNAIHPIIQGDGIDPVYPEMLITVTIEGKSPDEYFD